MSQKNTELCNKPYKTKEEQEIFLGFSNFETTNKAKSFWVFVLRRKP
jgi:hypothetical protein